jgi:hypothetical protein
MYLLFALLPPLVLIELVLLATGRTLADRSTKTRVVAA